MESIIFSCVVLRLCRWLFCVEMYPICELSLRRDASRQYRVMSKLEVLYYCSISIDIVGGLVVSYSTVALKFKVEVRMYNAVQDSDPRPTGTARSWILNSRGVSISEKYFSTNVL